MSLVDPADEPTPGSKQPKKRRLTVDSVTDWLATPLPTIAVAVTGSTLALLGHVVTLFPPSAFGNVGDWVAAIATVSVVALAIKQIEATQSVGERDREVGVDLRLLENRLDAAIRLNDALSSEASNLRRSILEARLAFETEIELASTLADSKLSSVGSSPFISEVNSELAILADHAFTKIQSLASRCAHEPLDEVLRLWQSRIEVLCGGDRSRPASESLLVTETLSSRMMDNVEVLRFSATAFADEATSFESLCSESNRLVAVLLDSFPSLNEQTEG